MRVITNTPKKLYKSVARGFHNKSTVSRWVMFSVLLLIVGAVFLYFRHDLLIVHKQLKAEELSLKQSSHRYDTMLSGINNRVYASQLVSSSQVISLLRIFTQGVDVKLISLKNSSAKPFGPLFLHPVDLVVQGDYKGVMTYLQRLEKSNYKVYWQKLHLQLLPSRLVEATIDMEMLGDSSSWVNLGASV